MRIWKKIAYLLWIVALGIWALMRFTRDDVPGHVNAGSAGQVETGFGPEGDLRPNKNMQTRSQWRRHESRKTVLRELTHEERLLGEIKELEKKRLLGYRVEETDKEIAVIAVFSPPDEEESDRIRAALPVVFPLEWEIDGPGFLRSFGILPESMGPQIYRIRISISKASPESTRYKVMYVKDISELQDGGLAPFSLHDLLNSSGNYVSLTGRRRFSEILPAGYCGPDGYVNLQN